MEKRDKVRTYWPHYLGRRAQAQNSRRGHTFTMANMPKRVAAWKFIEAWQRATAIDEVALALRVPREYLEVEARLYRSGGVALKPLRGIMLDGPCPEPTGYRWLVLRDFARRTLREFEAQRG